MANRTIVEIDADTSGAESGLGSLGDLFGGMGPLVAGFAATAGAAILGLAVVIGKTAVDNAMSFDAAVKSVGKATGATGSEMNEFGGIIKNLYVKGLGEDYQDLADKLAEVKKQTNLSGSELETFTKHATAFGSAFDTDISENTRAAKMLMDQFGVSSTEAFNLMTQGMQKGLNKNDDMLDSINEYGVHFKQMGFSAEEMFAIMTNGAKSGAFSVDKVGDAMKEFGIRVKDGSKGTNEAFKMIGLDAKKMGDDFRAGGDRATFATTDVITGLNKMKDKAKQNTAGVALFGTMWEDLGPEVIGQLDNIAGTYDKSKKSADKLISTDYKSMGDALKGVQRMVEVNLLLPLGQAFLPLINLVAGVAQKILPVIMGVFSKIGGFLKSAFGPEVQKVMSALQTQLSGLGGKGQGLMKDLVPVFNIIKKAVGDMAKTWGNYMVTLVAQIPTFLAAVKDMAPTIMAVVAVIVVVLSKLYSIFFTVLSKIVPIVVAAFRNLGTIVSAGMKLMKGTISIIMNAIKGNWGAVWARIKSQVSIIVNAIKAIVKNSFNALNKLTGGALGRIKSTVSRVWNAIKAINLSIVRGIVSGVRSAFSKIYSFISSKMSAVRSKISSMWSSIKGIFGRGLASGYKWGRNLISSFAKGVSSRLSALKNTVKKAVSGIKSFLGFHSPAKEGPGADADTWAPNLMNMFADGINDGIPALKKAVANAGNTVGGMGDMNVYNSGPAGVNNVAINALVLNDQTINLLTQRIARTLTRGGL